MRKALILFCCGMAMLGGWADRGTRCVAASPARRTAPQEQFRPRWQVGQRWVVETTTKTGRFAGRASAAGRPVRWQFTVLRLEQVGGKDCFRVEILCQNVEGQPDITIWVDEQTLALRQAETGLLVQGEVRRMKERYDADGGAGSPVIALPSALPLDLPVFSADSPRSGRFGYKALTVDDDDRPAADLAFAVEVEQSLKPAGRVETLRLLGEDAKRDGKTLATYDVRLRANGREVRQLWQAGLPWPSYSSSGGSTSRLVHVAAVVPVALERAARPSRRAAPAGRSAVAGSSMAAVGRDEGRSRFVPWSGYWWKTRQGGMLRTLRKYDLLTGKQSAAWEAQAKDPKTAADWSGYCHAWAAASVVEREPRTPRTVSVRGGRSAVLSVGDQKAWLTICHDQDESVSYGERYNSNADDSQDIYPDQLWRYLRLYVKQRGVPLIVDIDPGTEVWNYPVYRYRVTHRPHTTAGLRIGTMEIWMADNLVRPDFIGTKVKKKTYQFTFRMNGKTLVMGSGQWYGASRKDHPDFAWYPTMVRPKNPHIKLATVRRMVGSESSSFAFSRAPQRATDQVRIAAGIDLHRDE